MGPAQAESWGRCRSSPVEEMGEALPVWCGRDAPRSRVGIRWLRTGFSSCS